MQLQKSLRVCALLLLFLLFKGFSLQAQTIQYNRADSLMADSLLSLAFQNEALYSLQGPLKPISTVAQFSMLLDSITHLPLYSADFYRFMQLQKVANWLSNERFDFVIIPFARLFNHQRTMQMVVANRAQLAEELLNRRDFWFYWGLVPQSSPAIVITVVENAEKYRRFEGYGYLFGYPQNAVDFFVEAARIHDETGEFVSRSFYQMPVYSGQSGRFVYAIPENAEPRPEDLTIRKEAEIILNSFIAEFEPFKMQNPDLPFLKWYILALEAEN